VTANAAKRFVVLAYLNEEAVLEREVVLVFEKSSTTSIVTWDEAGD